MVVKYTRKGRDLQKDFTFAANNIHDFFQEALEETTDQTVKVSKNLAPVYNPLKYPTWSRMKHARGTHGHLKASIKRKPVKQTKRTLRTAIYSRKKYSSYIEHGFNHKIAREHILGRKYIGVPMKVVHQRLLPRKIHVAFKKAFREI